MLYDIYSKVWRINGRAWKYIKYLSDWLSRGSGCDEVYSPASNGKYELFCQGLPWEKGCLHLHFDFISGTHFYKKASWDETGFSSIL